MATGLIFRLFISSTFSDFTAERESLQNEVFPQLADYCQKHAATFQAVDLRWGITEEAQREHDTMRICLEEVRRCQQLSPRPNFAVLLGDRYGWEPVPARIPQDHWKRLMAAASLTDRVLIEKSYKLDFNAIPPVYCLLQRRLERGSGWEDHEAKLLQALRRSASGFRGRARLPYFASATHQEIVLGALISKDERQGKLLPNEHVHVYMRHLEGLPQDETAKDFIDWDSSKQQLAPGARDRLRGLEAKLRRKLGDHVHDLHTHWRQHGHNGAVDEAYLKRFCESFLVHQKAVIDAELASGLLADDRQLREEAHRDFGAERARVFSDRQTLLKKISKYTELVGKAVPKDCQSSDLTAPLILLGAGGSGKSALLAKAAQLHRKRAKGTGAIILERYIGGVPGTESLMSTLTALTADIANLYDQPEPPVPGSAKGLAESFLKVLGNASEKRPLHIYLDALDQLDSADSAWMLEWLPKKLLPHVNMVVSARTGTNVEQSARSRHPKSLIEIPPMKPTEGRGMLKLWLADKRSAWFNAGIVPTRGRRLTAIQQETLLRAFNHNGSALWLKLAYEEASSWKSWDAPRDLPADIQGLIEDLIDRRLLNQENHPRVLTERALAYLTAGRFGLSETELSRALGTDAAVRAEFVVLEKTQRKWGDSKQLPPILWSRLYFDLQPYLGLAKVDGVLLMRWFHREFADVMKGRYLRSLEDRAVIHGVLADTFHALELELRPEESNDDALFRSTDVTGNQVSVALRRVMEHPWQLAQAERIDDLQAMLTDFGFCMGKCAARRGGDLVKNVIDSKTYIFASPQRRRWSEFLLSVGHLLRSDSKSWPAHRVLLQLSLENQDLQSHCAIDEWTKLYPNWHVVKASPNLTSGCEIFPMVTFEGHSGNISGVHPLPNSQILSWSSSDSEIRVWNLFSGETLGILRHEANVVDIEVTSDYCVLSSSQDQMLNVWSLESQVRIAKFCLWGTRREGVGGFRAIDSTRVAHWSAVQPESADYTINIQSLLTGELLATLSQSAECGHTDYILGVLSLGDDSLVSWSHDQTLRRWSIRSGVCQSVSLDLKAPIVEVKLSETGSIHVQTLPSLWHHETVNFWVLCADTLQPLQELQELRNNNQHRNLLPIESGNFKGEIRWNQNRIALYFGDSTMTELSNKLGPVAQKSETTAKSPPKLTALKILPNDKILAGLTDGSLALIDAETGATLDQIPGRADCAGSGCAIDGDSLAIWSTEPSGKNLLRIWHPTTSLKIEKQLVTSGRVSDAHRVAGGLLTWGSRSLVHWQISPLREIGRIDHPARICFVHRIDSYGQFASCDFEGNVALWNEKAPMSPKWLNTKRRGVEAVRIDQNVRLLVLYRQSGREFIEGFDMASGISLGVVRRKLNKRLSPRGRVRVDGNNEFYRSAIKLSNLDGTKGLWINRGKPVELIEISGKGIFIARRSGELLLIQTGESIISSHLTNFGKANNLNFIFDEEMVNLQFSLDEQPTENNQMTLADVFETIRKWVSNFDLARLDTPNFKGKTWVGGDVFVISAFNPRAAQEVRRYQNSSYAHQDRFGLITCFPKAVDLLLKKFRDEVSPHLYMDKDHFYTEVAQSIAEAEKRGEDLSGVLFAGVERAQELVQKSGD
jgi:WD40 repeat protein